MINEPALTCGGFGFVVVSLPQDYLPTTYESGARSQIWFDQICKEKSCWANFGTELFWLVRHNLLVLITRTSLMWDNEKQMCFTPFPFDSGTYLLLTVAWFDNHRLMDQCDDKKGLFKIGDTTMRV